MLDESEETLTAGLLRREEIPEGKRGDQSINVQYWIHFRF